MRDENDDLKDRLEDIVANIKSGKLECEKCTVKNGKEIERE